MENVIIATVLSFVITYFGIPILIKVAELKNLYDEPDERKSHKTLKPTLGGMGFFAGFIIALSICAPSQSMSPLQYLLGAFFIIFMVGLKDDIVGLSPLKKLIGQICAAFCIIYLGNIQITSMYGLFGVQELPYHISLLLTYFTFIVVINAFNLIDGVDGLAGSIGMLVAGVLGAYFLFVHEVLFAVLGFSMAAALAAFLIYNISPSKIFMGDTGSLLIGLVNTILVVKFISVAGNPASALPVAAVPAVAIAILIIPLFDTLRVFMIRMSKGRSPFSADRNHIHHYLLALKLNHRQTTLSLVLTNAIFIAAAFALQNIGATSLLFIVLAAACVSTGCVYWAKKRVQAKSAPLPEPIPAAQTTIISPNPKILKVNTEGVLQDK
ncbi:undecaprenyl-phosphate alpha-N-acetylglucosaminyl 1-phosphate transferase [Chitinophaga caeni]|uniref:Undecaprenyl-phosphate alpha-N-acetylglucosaminyl 1-phosphate transferase n=1 Tax=Chitinophaga caeni TaxID=2029983 RepID=A0A291R0N3_9BACT|nr:MraY family glycosyltransferase [Chitinophaga caeni]ATL49757.1 undecaprenyl-phosphate alpha-N-acetylglucosaminyl 1-phosphate transferase [Chitinophaga caeni]